MVAEGQGRRPAPKARAEFNKLQIAGEAARKNAHAVAVEGVAAAVRQDGERVIPCMIAIKHACNAMERGG